MTTWFPKFFIFFSVVFSLAISNTVSAADDMTVFLKSSGYGAAAGAVLGLASLALSENPDSKINNVARGASLGLYAGIGFGLYTLYGHPSSQPADETAKLPQFWISPVLHFSQLEGAQINWAHFSF
jgi:drug/metabolite transporter (DMT)-like permease